MKKRVLSALLAGAIALSLAVPARAAVPSPDEAAPGRAARARLGGGPLYAFWQLASVTSTIGS